MMIELGYIAEVSDSGVVIGVFENMSNKMKVHLQPGSVVTQITIEELNEFKKKEFNEYRMVDGKLKGEGGKKQKKETKYAALEKRVAKLEKTILKGGK